MLSTPPKKTRFLSQNIILKAIGDYSVFGNPAFPVPENPKAEHTIQKTEILNILLNTLDGYSVFGKPALLVSENPKAEHTILKSKF